VRKLLSGKSEGIFILRRFVSISRLLLPLVIVNAIFSMILSLYTMIRSYLLLIVFIFVSIAAFSQTEDEGGGRSTSLAPAKAERKAQAKRENKSFNGKTTYDAQKEYYERVVTVAKERRKAEKIMKKPQYSNPLYFGHKHPPRKHSPKRMRYCKECGIRH
jgi:hypothetical protein